MPLLGCIADDFTGATDLASMLVKHGMRTVQRIGVPRADEAAPDVDAVVVALKSRTTPARQAVEESLAALACGASIFRVHDVAEHVAALKVFHTIWSGGIAPPGHRSPRE